MLVKKSIVWLLIAVVCPIIMLEIAENISAIVMQKVKTWEQTICANQQQEDEEEVVDVELASNT